MTNGHQKFLEQNVYGLGIGDVIGLGLIILALAVLVLSGRAFESENEGVAERADEEEAVQWAEVEWTVASGEWVVKEGGRE